MKREGAKFLKVLCFFVSITLALVGCRGDVDKTGETTGDGDSAESRKAVGTPSKTPPPRLPSNLVLGSDPISVSSQKYAPPAKYNEVPFFADLVAAGKLPPISERLPLEPFVVGPGVLNSEQWLDWEVGRYGGTIRTTNLNGSMHELALAMGMTILRAPDQSTRDPLPAIVRSYEINSDFTQYTLTIREGLKWSDGVTVTTEDVRMTFELYGDDRIYPSFPIKARTLGRADGVPGELTIIDDLTFKVTFDFSYGQFLAELSSWIPDYTLLFRPAHFIKQFHADYTDMAEIQPILDELELDSWEDLVILKDMRHWELYREHGVGVPSLTPWIAEEVNSSVVRAVRNPYYWKVDTAGNQLPYIDRVEAEVSNQLQSIVLKTAAGEYDVVTSYAQIREMPLYRENAERSNIKTVLHGSINNPPILFLNHDFDYETEGSVWQQLISDPRFGSAIASAIDKEDVNNTLYFGRYTLDGFTKETFDPEASNALLDEIGMTERDGDGFRTDPNGNPFELTITTAEVSPDFLGLG